MQQAGIDLGVVRQWRSLRRITSAIAAALARRQRQQFVAGAGTERQHRGVRRDGLLAAVPSAATWSDDEAAAHRVVGAVSSGSPASVEASKRMPLVWKGSVSRRRNNFMSVFSWKGDLVRSTAAPARRRRAA